MEKRGGGHFSVTACHTVHRLFMNKLCVSLGHCCGPVTMASMVRGRRNVALLANRDARGGVGRGVFALDYFNHRSHLHLLAQGNPLPLSSSPLFALAVSQCPSKSLRAPFVSTHPDSLLESTAPALSLLLCLALTCPFVLTCSHTRVPAQRIGLLEMHVCVCVCLCGAVAKLPAG